MLSESKKRRNHEKPGTMLKEARTEAGFTQKALADALGLEYYTMISQMELGYISIPASLWVPISDKTRIDKHRFVLRCLHEIMPEVYRALFGIKSINEAADGLKALDLGKYEEPHNEP